jgi:hypothetical protein
MKLEKTKQNILIICLLFFYCYSITLGEIKEEECAKANSDVYEYSEALDLSNALYYIRKNKAEKYLDLCERAVKQARSLLRQQKQNRWWLNNLKELVVPCNNISKAIIGFEKESQLNEKIFLNISEARKRQKYFCKGKGEL